MIFLKIYLLPYNGKLVCNECNTMGCLFTSGVVFTWNVSLHQTNFFFLFLKVFLICTHSNPFYKKNQREYTLVKVFKSENLILKKNNFDNFKNLNA